MTMDVAGFEWDRANRGKCQKHGLSVAIIEALFHGKFDAFPDEAHSRDEERYIAIGKSPDGRSVFVAFTLRSQAQGVLIRPISARYMHRKETDYYEKEAAKIQNR